MTNDELNEAVARARGWTRTEEGNGQSWGVPPHEQDPSSPWGGQSMPVPDVCLDPAAWGALFEELSTTHAQVKLIYIYGQPQPWQATIWKGHKMFEAASSGPGRALGMAFLKSKGVEG